MKKQTKTLSDYLDPTAFQPEFSKPDDIEGLPVLISKPEYRVGNWGRFAVMTVTDPHSGDSRQITTGAKSVLNLLDELESNGAIDWPLLATFKRKGNAWYLDG